MQFSYNSILPSQDIKTRKLLKCKLIKVASLNGESLEIEPHLDFMPNFQTAELLCSAEDSRFLPNQLRLKAAL